MILAEFQILNYFPCKKKSIPVDAWALCNGKVIDCQGQVVRFSLVENGYCLGFLCCECYLPLISPGGLRIV